jgi:hypothetical protein
MAHAILLGATRHPDKLAELKELFWQEAERNCVLPLLGAFSLFLGDLPPLPTRGQGPVCLHGHREERGVRSQAGGA